MENIKPSTAQTTTVTEPIDSTDSAVQVLQQSSEPTPVLHLRLERPRSERRVSFHDGVIDNEHLNRKKSKCCCIYKKPLAFGESSSSSEDDECEHCFGHPEVRRKNRKKHEHAQMDGDHHDHHNNIDKGDSCSRPQGARTPITDAEPTTSQVAQQNGNEEVMKTEEKQDAHNLTISSPQEPAPDPTAS